MNQEEIDHIYYNIIIDSTDNTDAVAKYRAMNQAPILKKASDYYLTICRFYIPSSLIPLQIVPILPNQSNPNKTVYSLTLEYNGNISQQYLTYISEDTTLTPTDTGYYYMYNYTTFIKMVNTSLTLAFNAITPPLGSEAPFLQFDYSDNLFGFVVQRQYYDNTLPNPIKLYINDDLEAVITSLDTTYVNQTQGRIYSVNIYNQGNNFYNPNSKTPTSPPSYYLMNQFQTNLSAFQNLRSIFISSNTIPVNREYTKESSDSTYSLSVPILTDFNLVINDSGLSNLRTPIEYFANLYRLINLVSDAALYLIDIEVKFSTKNGKVYPLKIPFNETLSLKLLFLRKESAHLYPKIKEASSL